MADVATNLLRTFSAGVISGSSFQAQISTWFGNVGTGAGTAAVTDTSLFTETGTARITATTTNPTTTITGDTFQNVFTYTATGAITVTNAGIGKTVTNAAADIVQKSDFTGVPLQNTDSIQFTFKTQQT